MRVMPKTHLFVDRLLLRQLFYLAWSGKVTQRIDALSLLLVTDELGAVFAASRLVNEGQYFSEVNKAWPWPKEP